MRQCGRRPRISNGIQLLNRLAATCARGRDVVGDPIDPFPTPDDLARLEPEALDYDGAQRVLARWQPFQGLVYLHLLLWGLQPEHGKAASRGAPTR